MVAILEGTAFITGAGSGFGQAAAICLARHGVKAMALGDLSLKRLEETKQLLVSEVPQVNLILIEMDVGQESSVSNAIEQAVFKLGRIDYAVNNAGIAGPTAPTDRVAFADWQRLMDVNLNGVWLCQRSEIRQMLKQELQSSHATPSSTSAGLRGVIVNIASVLGLKGSNGKSPVTAYTAAKHGVMGLTKTDAAVYADQGIRINAICPGYIETPLLLKTLSDDSRRALLNKIPADRLGRAEEIGNSIVFLMSYLSSYMYGHGLVVDGGQMCA